MKIKHRLKFSAAVVATFIGILIFGFWVSSREILIREKKYASLEEIVFSFSDLNVLMHEFVLFREPRMERQWLAKFNATAVELKNLANIGTISSPLFQWIEEDFQAMGYLFHELERSKSEKTLGALSPPLERRLVTQLLVRSETVKTHLRELLEEAHSGLYAAQKKGFTFVSSLTLGLVLVGGIVICVFLMVVGYVNKLIRELISGTQWIGSGDLDYRLPEYQDNELAEVARAFNQMAAHLKKTLVSRDQLSREIEERSKAEEALRQNEASFRLLFHHNPSPMWVVDADNLGFLEVNEAAIVKYGYSREEFLQMNLKDIRPPEDVPEFLRAYAGTAVRGTGPVPREWRHKRKDGSIIDVEIVLDVLEYRGRKAFLTAIHDVTERITAERFRKESEERFKRLSDSAFEAVIIHKDGSVVEVNRAFYLMFGYEAPEEIIGQPVLNLVAPPFRDFVLNKIRSGDESHYEMEMLKKDGAVMSVEVRARMIPYQGGIARVATLNNITDWKRTEALLREREARLRLLIDQMPAILWSTDQRLMFTSAVGAGLGPLKMEPQQMLGKNMMDLFGEGVGQQESLEAHSRALKGESSTYETIWSGRSFEVHVEPLRDDSAKISGTVGVALDITERKDSESKLKEAANDLARSNKELEQFAYVASHDLQEPLRMVASYMDLLGRKYRGQLDENADEFIGYAVDGAKRMKQLIDDLLTYSRVGRSEHPNNERVNMRWVLERVQANLKLSVDESRAEIVYHGIPDLRADMVQLTQLFQNLLSNAIKFRSEKTPRVEIGSVYEHDEWVFFVKDNGIGLEMGYAERIFMIFQRLHTANEYPGTGIGLAICKKIVERYGGRIWITSGVGEGSTFYFTLPEAVVAEERSSHVAS